MNTDLPASLADLWDNKSKREQVWNSLKRNLYNNHLHEILLIFIDKIKDPEEFCSRVYRLQSDIFFSNLMLLGQLSSEIKRKVSKSRTIRALLSRFSKIWASCDPIGKAIEDEIVKYSYASGGIERLRLLLRIQQREHQGLLKRLMGEIISDCRDEDFVPLFKEIYIGEEDIVARGVMIEGILRGWGNAILTSLLKDIYQVEQHSRTSRRHYRETGRYEGRRSYTVLEADISSGTRVKCWRDSITFALGRGGPAVIPFLKQAYTSECQIRGFAPLLLTQWRNAVTGTLLDI